MLELALLIFVYTVGHWLWRSETGLEITTWYASPEGKNLHLTLAGTWYNWVSLPIFQFFCCDGMYGSQSGTAFYGAYQS